jgi:hypothetical protein
MITVRHGSAGRLKQFNGLLQVQTDTHLFEDRQAGFMHSAELLLGELPHQWAVPWSIFAWIKRHADSPFCMDGFMSIN